MKTNIIVNLHHEAIHNWPDCNIQEVMFLRNPHRHIFHISCKKKVFHDDRDIEIIQLKREIQKFLNKNYGGDFGSNSCEMIARELCTVYELNYCRVLEDGENGAEVVL